MDRDITIIGLVVDERASHAPEVQDVLTRYGSNILSRSGIPAPSKNRGIITLVMEAGEQERQEMEQHLQQIHGVQVKTISFGIPADSFN
ncbi:TM1266 family iron-only hydrogenase system putative regulator [Desulfofalx alkaliphila]|uniref:TM1266 family iron-only hydrogenase system putative regulator n=1 Tax=Desulfofalx alkaliphila TaxID=105483 RepID=UPI0004E11789|nr:TM1266 family iron-only hydrogenase system putative regulator [Desulfofalx alkaliphila]